MKRFMLYGLLSVLAVISVSAKHKTKQDIRPRNMIMLTALPGSGKSEIRHYISTVDPVTRQKDFGMDKVVEIDDFPYVFFMRRVSDEAIKRGKPGVFFLSPALPFVDPYTWGVLTQLMNEDYDDMVNQNIAQPKSTAMWLFDRIDKARKKVGVAPIFKKMNRAYKAELAKAVEKDAKKLLNEKNTEIRKAKDLSDKTVIFECARGGADSSPMPLPKPLGYQYTFGQLSPEILDQMSVLYVQVDPAESRRKNDARANPNDPGSILNHCVPQAVMFADYGCDDIKYLKKTAEKPNTVTIKAHGKKWHVPIGVFDNRKDKTTFVRSPQKVWRKKDVKALHGGLKEAFACMKK